MAAMLNCLMTESMWSPSLEGKMKSIRGPSHKAAVRNQTTKFFPKLVTNSFVNRLLLKEVKVTIHSKRKEHHT